MDVSIYTKYYHVQLRSKYTFGFNTVTYKNKPGVLQKRLSVEKLYMLLQNSHLRDGKMR